MDITTDGFGFMLAVGDLCWVPFVYTLQARYLVFNQVELGYARTIAILALNGLGYYIFRTANGEKNDFRNGKNPKSEFKSYEVEGCPHPFMQLYRSSIFCDQIWIETYYFRLVGSLEASELFVSILRSQV